MKAVLVAGATGAIGDKLVEQLLSHPDEITVHVVSRRVTRFQQHPQVIEHIIPLTNIDKLQVVNGVDAVCCCLGTTINTAGSKQAFRAVDLDAVLALGQWASSQNIPQFHVVSSFGVHQGSRSFYLQTKYQMEQGLIALALPQLYIYQPSMLIAQRDKFRLGEVVGGWLMQLFAWLPKSARWRPVAVERVALSMSRNLERPQAGVHYISSAKIQASEQ